MTSVIEKFIAHLCEQPAFDVPNYSKEDPRPAIEAALELATARPEVHRFLSTLVERKGCFALFDIEMHPAVLTMKPWKADVMSPREVSVATTGAGDLYLWNVDDDSVRFIDHELECESTPKAVSFEGFLEEALGTCLELLEMDALDELDDRSRADLRFAIATIGDGRLDEAVRKKLVKLGG